MIGVVDRTLFEHLCGHIEQYAAIFLTKSERKFDLHFYEDDALSPRCRRKGRNHYSIYFPTGAFNRLTLFSLIIMSEKLDNLGLVRFPLSPTDCRDIDNIIPGRLRSIFDSQAPIEDEHVESILKDFPLNGGDSNFLRGMLVSGFSFLLNHEFWHIDCGHFEFRRQIDRNPEKWTSNFTLGCSLRDLLEGLEVSADQMAASALAAYLRGLIEGEAIRSRVDVDDEGIAFRIMMPFAMGIAATISLFDWKSRSFDAFVGTSYPHPVIRWAIIQWVIRERLGWDTVAAQAWEFHSERALRMVNGRIGAATLVESERVQAEDPNFELGLPIAQLQMDKSRFGQSVRFDYLIRSIERGRRAEYALNDFSAEDMPLQPFMADVDALWQAYLARLRIMNAERSKN